MRLFLALLPLVAIALVPLACTAQLEEGCLSGPCIDRGTGGANSTTSSSTTTTASGTGGMGGAGGSAPTVGDFPCAVFQVIQDKCATCHQSPPKNGATFPLLTYEDTQKPLGQKTIVQRMAEVIQPNGVPHMPFGMAPQLTTNEFTTLDDWLSQGAFPEPDGMGCECPGMGCAIP